MEDFLIGQDGERRANDFVAAPEEEPNGGAERCQPKRCRGYQVEHLGVGRAEREERRKEEWEGGER